jgi:hypothetical protein
VAEASLVGALDSGTGLEQEFDSSGYRESLPVAELGDRLGLQFLEDEPGISRALFQARVRSQNRIPECLERSGFPLTENQNPAPIQAKAEATQLGFIRVQGSLSQVDFTHAALSQGLQDADIGFGRIQAARLEAEGAADFGRVLGIELRKCLAGAPAALLITVQGTVQVLPEVAGKLRSSGRIVYSWLACDHAAGTTLAVGLVAENPEFFLPMPRVLL